MGKHLSAKKSTVCRLGLGLDDSAVARVAAKSSCIAISAFTCAAVFSIEVEFTMVNVELSATAVNARDFTMPVNCAQVVGT